MGTNKGEEELLKRTVEQAMELNKNIGRGVTSNKQVHA